MTYRGETNPDLTQLVGEYDDSELLRTRVETIRQIVRLIDFLSILNEERRLRAPDDLEARALPSPMGGFEEAVGGSDV